MDDMKTALDCNKRIEELEEQIAQLEGENTILKAANELQKRALTSAINKLKETNK